MLLEPVSLGGKSLNSLSWSNASGQEHIPMEEKSRSREELAEQIKHTNEVIADMQNKMKILHNVDLSFSIHKASGKVVVTVVDENTGEVIREIPSSEALNLATKLEETIGLMLDKKV